MNIQDIITALSGWGLPVRAEQLTHPTAEFVEGVYCACLQQVTGVTFESLREPVASSISSLEIDSEVIYGLVLGELIRRLQLARLVFNCFLPQPYSLPSVSYLVSLLCITYHILLGHALQKLHKWRTSLLKISLRLKRREPWFYSQLLSTMWNSQSNSAISMWRNGGNIQKKLLWSEKRFWRNSRKFYKKLGRSSQLACFTLVVLNDRFHTEPSWQKMDPSVRPWNVKTTFFGQICSKSRTHRASSPASWIDSRVRRIP